MAAGRCQACGMAIDLLADVCLDLVSPSRQLQMLKQPLTSPGSSCLFLVNTSTLATGHQRTASYTLSDQMRATSSLS